MLGFTCARCGDCEGRPYVVLQGDKLCYDCYCDTADYPTLDELNAQGLA
jgi:hypothetical protein